MIYSKALNVKPWKHGDRRDVTKVHFVGIRPHLTNRLLESVAYI